MAAEWYYAKSGQQLGPVATEELRTMLRTGEIKSADLVWKDGMSDWSPAGTISILKSAKTAAPAPAASPSKTKAATSAPQRVGSTPEPVDSEPIVGDSDDASATKGPGFFARGINSIKQFSQRFSTKQKLVVGGGLAGFVVLAIVLLWWFKPSSSGFADHLKYAPNKTVAVAYIDLAQILNSEFYKTLEDDFDREVRRGVDQISDQFKIKPQDIASISVWVNVDEFPQILTVVRTRTAISDDVFENVEAMQAEVEEIGSVQMHTLRTRESIAVAFPTNMTALIGDPKLIEDILERGKNPPKFSDSMNASLKRASFEHSITFVGDLDGADSLFKYMPGGDAVRKHVGPFVSYVDIANTIKLTFTILKDDSEDPLASFSLLVDAVELVALADRIKRAERDREEPQDE
ncbi:MAG: GYF domain-containing protein, partial [Planctomycetota bacterium]|nr:GYF domain-containing protein [Planctomycetota bacterium]